MVEIRYPRFLPDSGLMTEFDIPTGPLATVVYIAVSPDAAKIWFTEWASNRIAYLDNTLAVPLKINAQSYIQSTPLVLRINQTYPLDVMVTRNKNSAPLLLLNQIELSVVGMSDSGLHGLTYIAKPQRFKLNETSRLNATIDLNLDVKESIAGKYTVMVRISTLEKNNLTVSLLYPQSVTVDVPIHKSQLPNLPISVNE